MNYKLKVYYEIGILKLHHYFRVAWRKMYVDIENNAFYRRLMNYYSHFSKMRLLMVCNFKITDSVKETIKFT